MIEGYQRPAGYSEAGRRIEEAGRAYQTRTQPPAPEAVPEPVAPPVKKKRRPPPKRDFLWVAGRVRDFAGIRQRILAEACELFGVTVEDLLTNEFRSQRLVLPRQYAMQRLSDQYSWTCWTIGKALNRDQSSVRNGLLPRARAKVAAWLERQPG